jgi:hypothetical protein
MVQVNWLLEYTSDLGGTGVDDTIDNFYDIQVIKTLGDGRDRLQFKVPSNVPEADLIQNRSKIAVSRRVNDTNFTPDDVEMVAAVNKRPRTDGISQSYRDIRGNNFSKTIMDAVVFLDATDESIVDTLKLSLQSISNYSQDYGVTWNPNNPDLTTDGQQFPDYGEKLFFKSFVDVAERASQNSKTGDGDYYYYVDLNNTFVWRPENTDSDKVIDKTYPYISAKEKLDSDDVINYVRIKGDTLPSGKAIEAEARDYGSMNKHGVRFRVVQSESKLAGNTHNATMSELGADSDDTFPSDINGFSYPFTPSWNGGNSVSTDKEYSDALGSYVRRQLEDEANKIIDVNSNGYFMLELEVSPADNDFSLGENVTVKLPEFPEKVLRVTELQLTSTVDVVTLKEDTPTI